MHTYSKNTQCYKAHQSTCTYIKRCKSGSLAFVWVLGFYAVVAGVTRIAYALRARDELSRIHIN
jgi:hypothetical protein